MKIYTSYFARTAALHKAGIVPIGIALSPPDFFRFSSIGYLAPRPYMMRMQEEEYTKRFRQEILRPLNPQWVVNELEKISKGKDVALLCFESPEKFCHRQLVAQWIKRHLKIEVVEWGYTPVEPKKIEPVVQSKLMF